jgi:23S rRNA (uracil-5-)-methyltransferase RumA/MAF protein
MKVILASESRRRISLLKKIFKSFSVIPSGLNENQYLDEDPVRFALKAAEAKAREVAEAFPEALVIAADTVVVTTGNQILGKPRDRDEARQMLQTLSGQTHRVITAIALFQKAQDKLLSDFETSLATFKKLPLEDIETYLDFNTYRDKAGAYAIQEVKDRFLEKLEGDYYNVVGLPLKKLRQLVHKFLEQRFEVDISSFILPDGLGVAQSEDRTFLVAGTYPGDRVEIAFEQSARKTIKARLISVIIPSPSRRPAPCEHFGLCGGCSFQDLEYNEQLHQKIIYLLHVLKEYFPSNYRYLELEEILPSPDEYFYRNKMEFSFGEANGEVFLGLKEKIRNREHKREKKVVHLEKCYISTPLTEKIFPVFSEFVRKSGLPVFDLQTRQGFFRHLVIREGKQTGELMLLLVTTSLAKIQLDDLTQDLLRLVPELKSFWWVENDRIADVVAFEKIHLIYGQQAIEENLLGFRFKIYLASFLQTNPKAAELVYSRIVEEARKFRTQSALGLYCGSGAIEICLSRVAGEVVGVDWDAANIKAAEENARINNLKNVRFRESPVEAVLPEIYRGAFDLLIIDPPRAGVSLKGLKQIVSLKIPNIFYVSCNPVTLARDLQVLIDSGYQITRLSPLDFFPHTAHLEVLAFLSR